MLLTIGDGGYFPVGGKMKPLNKQTYLKRRGAVLIISMIFILVFSALAVSMASLSGANLQIADNQRKVNSALSAAQSAMECGKYIVANIPALPETLINAVTPEDVDQVWGILVTHVQNQSWVAGQATQTSNEIITPVTSYGAANASFQVRFYRDTNSTSIQLGGIGIDGQVKRQVSIDMDVIKDNEVLNYAIASRGRIWLTGDTTVYGDIFSPWNRPEISPYNMTSDSTVFGTINTVLTLEQILEDHSPYANYQLETLDGDGNPLDVNGNPLGTNYEYRYYSPDDQVQAYHEGINYGQPYYDIPGMDISDYDTSLYEDNIAGDVPTPYANGYYGDDASLESLPPTCGTLYRYERFPHDAGNYTTGDGSTFKRYIYKDQTFTDVRLTNNRNALFINCIFNGVLYIDCSKTNSSYTNNVRFDNCTFNGTIVSDTPQYFNWRKNCLYFTGEAMFDNQTGIEEATILAPHFNVNLGNTNPEQGDNNVLTGAIVGGIVDVRGNALINGTIISMCDTTPWSSGYVTNIGATLGDGGSETTDPGDVGVISITPEEDKMLPSGISTPIVIKPLQDTYSEEV